MKDRQDTIAAIATPAGSGGIGIIRLSGPRSLYIARQMSHIEPAPRHAHFCTFSDQQGRALDQGLLLYFPAPASFTGEDVIELHGHGGRVVLGLLLNEALGHGARLARPGEFSERAWLNDRIDLLQAEAIADLINSVSAQAVRSAARSLEGVFSQQIHRIVEEVISLRVYIEGALDFPEEEIDFLGGTDIQIRLASVLTALDDLLIRAEAGRKLGAGLRVAIIGQPNVGKSSLLNRLAQTDRAIVTEIAGTTRDTIEETVLIGGVAVTLVDTAGIRESSDVVEREGIKRSREEAARADVLVLMTDNEEPETWLGLHDEAARPTNDRIVVHNKIDISNLPPTRIEIDGVVQVYLSAKTGEGIELLRQELARRAGTEDAGEDVILARQRHIDALVVARQAIESGKDIFNGTGSAELLAEELRKAQQSLAGITGEFHNEQLLGEIFSRFCIGK